MLFMSYYYGDDGVKILSAWVQYDEKLLWMLTSE